MKCRQSSIEFGAARPFTIGFIRNFTRRRQSSEFEYDFQKYGLSSSEVLEVRGFGDNPDNAKHEIRYTAPVYSLVGDYQAHGKVLVLPIEGAGKANLTMENPVITYKFTTKAVERNGETFAEIVKSKYSYNDLGRLYMQFGNLINADKALTDNINMFLNENWKEIFNELKPKIAESFGEVTTQLISTVLTKRAYKDLFKEK